MRHSCVRLKFALLVLLVLGIAGVGTSFFRRDREKTLEELSNASDSIVIGVCRQKNAHFVGKMIETDYEVEVTERLKGHHKSSGKDTVMVTIPGGELTTPPITQAVSFTPLMYVGEEVALFLADAPAVQATPGVTTQGGAKTLHPNSKLRTSPQVVGWAEGKFSVVTDKKSGQKKVARIIPDDYGWTNNDRAIRNAIHAVSTGAAPVVEGEVVPIAEGIYTTPEGKSVLDKITQGVTYAEEQQRQQQKKAAAGAKPAAAKKAVTKQQPYGPVVVQDFEDFKAKVRSFVK